MLYEYTNKEMDIAAACFRIGNYYSLRDMPDDFTANNVNQAMRERLEKAQIISAINAQNRKIYATLGGGGGVFQKFDWMPDEFSLRKSVNKRPLNILVDESKKRATFERQMKQMNMHGDLPFNPAQVKANNKYEYPFLGKDE